MQNLPIRLNLIINDKPKGTVLIKTRADYKRLRQRGFSRPDSKLNTTLTK